MSGCGYWCLHELVLNLLLRGGWIWQNIDQTNAKTLRGWRFWWLQVLQEAAVYPLHSPPVQVFSDSTPFPSYNLHFYYCSINPFYWWWWWWGGSLPFLTYSVFPFFHHWLNVSLSSVLILCPFNQQTPSNHCQLNQHFCRLSPPLFPVSCFLTHLSLHVLFFWMFTISPILSIPSLLSWSLLEV